RIGRGLLGAYSTYAIASRIREGFLRDVERGIQTTDAYQRLGGEMPYEQFRTLTTSGIRSFTPEETLWFTRTYGAATGTTGYALGDRVKETGEMSRLFGFSPEQGGALFGQAGRIGVVGPGQGEQRAFAKLLAEAVAEGRMKGREGEVFESIL